MPPKNARTVQILEIGEARRAVIEARGLPECGEFRALDAAAVAAWEGGDDKARQLAFEALRAHQRACPVCHARAAYLGAQAPPIPEPHLPLLIRGLGSLVRMSGRLLGALRPPRGPAGEYRRWGVVLGAFFTVIVAAAIGVGVVVELLTVRTGEGSALEVALAIPAIGAAYVVGGYLSGAAWDATRRIRHRLIGYVLRGGGTAAAMYGAVGLVFPVMDVDPLAAELYPFAVAGAAALGAVLGAGKWVKDGWMDDLPAPPAGQSPA